jgi:thiamine thiazole synthase
MSFYPIGEAKITRAISSEFLQEFGGYIESDVVIVGAGPSGLVAARDLAQSGLKTLVVESNNYLGGGFWIGGYFMNTLTFRSPGEDILDELDIKYTKIEEGLYTAKGPEACSKLIAAACDAGVKFLQMTKCDDVVCRHGRLEGVVVNWAAVSALPRAITCVDPVALEARAVVDATGHDARVCQALQKRGLLSFGECGAMDVVGSKMRSWRRRERSIQGSMSAV